MGHANAWSIPNSASTSDFRGILHVHAEDAEHTLGTRQQVLDGRQGNRRQRHPLDRPSRPQARHLERLSRRRALHPGLRRRSPTALSVHADGDLKFLSHLEELPPDASSDGYDGMEIYNRHTDAKVQTI